MDTLCIRTSIEFDDSPAAAFNSTVTDDGFDYLAIGNSITQHPITDFWWGEWGMAAGIEDNDYYHLVAKGLQRRCEEEINTAAYNYYIWETQAHDRTETYEFLDKWLTAGIDLVTVQLSENASDLTTFEADFSSLLRHIREVCGDETQIIVIDDFWSDEKSTIKKTVAEELEADFIDLSDIRGVTEYQAGIGTNVLENNG